ncbi:guided entry of tail-anchored proteins factor 1-like [Stegodyphus dumicola]|uniref:guided entry of tail-anchored proteins factor 1-like n=1 Tax=Stegodyphus dumicola TaxID=202533 RepID=UPI0015ADCCC5|nr:guided entry of tail-anchored proteins factor 1-like [Stegodyphus dumicola]
MSSSFDVKLFWMGTLCGMFSSFIPIVVKMILQVINRETEMEANLRRQVCDLKAELGSISMVDEFAKYAKIKRKVNKVTDELSHQSDIRSSYTLKVRFIATAALYTIMGFAIVFLLWNYRKVPVAVLPEKWLYPLASVLSYPSGVPGGISLTAWLFISGSFGRVMATSLTL